MKLQTSVLCRVFFIFTKTRQGINKGSNWHFWVLFSRSIFVMMITLLLKQMLCTNIMYICTYVVVIIYSGKETKIAFLDVSPGFHSNYCYVILVVRESRGPCWGNLKAPDMFNYNTETCEKQSWVSLTGLQCTEIKLCLHVTFACACLCAWKFNIVLMETQTQTQRMGSEPFFWNANVKCKHLYLVSWKPWLHHS